MCSSTVGTSILPLRLVLDTVWLWLSRLTVKMTDM